MMNINEVQEIVDRLRSIAASMTRLSATLPVVEFVGDGAVANRFDLQCVHQLLAAFVGDVTGDHGRYLTQVQTIGHDDFPVEVRTTRKMNVPVAEFADYMTVVADSIYQITGELKAGGVTTLNGPDQKLTMIRSYADWMGEAIAQRGLEQLRTKETK